jgi:hypothetical protein
MKKLLIIKVLIMASFFTYAQVQLTAKVFLNNFDVSTGLMPDNFRNDVSNFPIHDPYSAVPGYPSFVHINNPIQAVTNSGILDKFNVVDWVFIELRQGCDIITTKAALVTNNGNVIDEQGNNTLSFNAPLSAYRIVIRHRNHLDIATEKDVDLSSPKFLDFTTTAVLGNISHSTSFFSNANGTISMVGGNGEIDNIIDNKDEILWSSQNGNWGDYDYNADYNLDGSVDAIDTILLIFNQGLVSDPCN